MRNWLSRKGKDGPAPPEVKERHEAILRSLTIPRPFDPHAFLDRLAAERQRPIVLHPWPAMQSISGATGMWIATESTDRIFYVPTASVLHRHQIIFHECAHMLLGHRLTIDLSETERLLPDLGPTLIQRALARTTYDSDQEQEAEMLATMILREAYGYTTDPTWSVPPEAADLIERVDCTLRHAPNRQS